MKFPWEKKQMKIIINYCSDEDELTCNKLELIMLIIHFLIFMKQKCLIDRSEHPVGYSTQTLSFRTISISNEFDYFFVTNQSFFEFFLKGRINSFISFKLEWCDGQVELSQDLIYHHYSEWSNSLFDLILSVLPKFSSIQQVATNKYDHLNLSFNCELI